MAGDQEKTTAELLNDLMSKVSALQGDVSALQQQGPTGNGRKRSHDGDSSDAIPGSSRDGDDDPESERSDLDPDDATDVVPEGDGLSFQLSEEGEAFLEATFGARL